jgi:hypothetical protein
MNNFNQTAFETNLIATLVRRLRSGLKGRKTITMEINRQWKALRKIGYSVETAQAIIDNCKDMATLTLLCETV